MIRSLRSPQLFNEAGESPTAGILVTTTQDPSVSLWSALPVSKALLPGVSDPSRQSSGCLSDLDLNRVVAGSRTAAEEGLEALVGERGGRWSR